MSSTLCERCAGLQHSVGCMLISICVTKCLLNLLVYLNVTSGEKPGQRSCPCFWFMQNLNRILCDIYQKHVTNYVHYWTWVLCQASIENARLSWEVFFNIVMWFKKTKQDVLRENRVYYCIEKECLLRKFKTKLPGKLLTMKEI